MEKNKLIIEELNKWNIGIRNLLEGGNYSKFEPASNKDIEDISLSIERALEKTSNESGNCNKPLVTNCVALPEWLSKERCVVAASIWNSHQEGDNKRVEAIKQIKKWAADAGYEIGFKKANELFKQHCL